MKKRNRTKASFTLERKDGRTIGKPKGASRIALNCSFARKCNSHPQTGGLSEGENSYLIMVLANVILRTSLVHTQMLLLGLTRTNSLKEFCGCIEHQTELSGFTQ